MSAKDFQEAILELEKKNCVQHLSTKLIILLKLVFVVGISVFAVLAQFYSDHIFWCSF